MLLLMSLNSFLFDWKKKQWIWVKVKINRGLRYLPTLELETEPEPVGC